MWGGGTYEKKQQTEQDAHRHTKAPFWSVTIKAHQEDFQLSYKKQL